MNCFVSDFSYFYEKEDKERHNIWAILRRHIGNLWLIKAMVLPVVMYGCESWTIKKAECRRIDAFELWC